MQTPVKVKGKGNGIYAAHLKSVGHQKVQKFNKKKMRKYRFTNIFPGY